VNEQPIVVKQRRDLSQIIEASVNVYRQNFWPLFQIAAVIIPLGIAGAVLQETIGGSNQAFTTEDISAGEIVALIALGLFGAAVQFVVAAALIAALADLAAGRAPEFSHAYDVGFDKFWTLVAAALRVFFHVFVLLITIVGIPWAIQRSVRWIFTAQAVILDGTSAKAALSYSADAVIGSWWRTLGIVIVIGIIARVPATMIGLLFSLAPPVIAGTVSSVVEAALLPFAVTATTLLYLDLKSRKEAVAAGTELPTSGADEGSP
jgi:hypothetical protein